MRPGGRTTAGELAHAWATHAQETTRSSADLHRAILEDIGAEHIAFDRCVRCGLEAAVPMRSWTSGNYPREAYGLAFDHQRALADLATLPSRAVLELGCAEGAFLAEAGTLGHRATGLDFVPEAVASARDRGLDAHVGDVKALLAAAPARRVDAIAMFQIVEHLEDPDAVFADLARIAAPGCRLYLGCPSPTRYSRCLRHAATVGDSDFWDWPPQHTLRWTDAAFRGFLPRHGWVVRSIEHEPLTIRGAAAHLTAIDGTAGGWYGNGPRRRAATVARLARVALRAPFGVTGLRMLVVADRA